MGIQEAPLERGQAKEEAVLVVLLHAARSRFGMYPHDITLLYSVVQHRRQM